MRLTEYHCGVAVIKDKALIGEAMEKLAAYEDAEELGMKITVDILPEAENKKEGD